MELDINDSKYKANYTKLLLAFMPELYLNFTLHVIPFLVLCMCTRYHSFYSLHEYWE